MQRDGFSCASEEVELWPLPPSPWGFLPPHRFLKAAPHGLFPPICSSAPFDRIAEINFSIDVDDDGVSSPARQQLGGCKCCPRGGRAAFLVAGSGAAALAPLKPPPDSREGAGKQWQPQRHGGRAERPQGTLALGCSPCWRPSFVLLRG